MKKVISILSTDRDEVNFLAGVLSMLGLIVLFTSFAAPTYDLSVTLLVMGACVMAIGIIVVMATSKIITTMTRTALDKQYAKKIERACGFAVINVAGAADNTSITISREVAQSGNEANKQETKENIAVDSDRTFYDQL